MKNKLVITPPLFKIILMSTIGLMLILTIGIFWFIHEQLNSFSVDVAAGNAAAASTSQDESKLEHLKSELDKSQVAVARTKKIVGDTKLYQYQNQIIDDLSAYANAAGFTIKGFSFVTATPGATTAAPATAATAAPAGLKSTIATITFPQSMSYLAYMNFLKSVENNLTKMNISGVSMHIDIATGTFVADPLTIGVYIK
jgi:hypothetical protein